MLTKLEHAFTYGFVDVSGSGRQDVLSVTVIATTCTRCGVIRERIVAGKLRQNVICWKFFMTNAALHVYKLLISLRIRFDCQALRHDNFSSEDKFRNCRTKDEKCHDNNPQDKIFHV